ncbi:unnamed protein product [Notodromas monacha]|uniref:Uncharacterized protein n=1 Tax=Notodromas monacha TaxID=399045 RepID=A0A7R9BM43_9CRUS|nr:unnamed protein product [Notodromas monacha]CAG0917181.1 unnamed protein product [Notodromas monacha]
MSEEELEDACKQLVAAVECSLDPATLNQNRIAAVRVAEDIKHGPLCVFCGLRLAQRLEYSTAVRHFGLHMLEHAIKFCWNQMTAGEKLFLKDKSLELINVGTKGFTCEETLIKDGIARLIVEIAKREWPQQWPGMLTELSQICLNGGEIQHELVLLFFLRLGEDTAVLQTIENSVRRREIQQALSVQIREIFDFFMRSLERFCKPMKLMSEMDRKTIAGLPVVKVAQTVLSTISAYIEWVPVAQIIHEDGRLLQMISSLLDDSDLRYGAAECLLLFCGRRFVKAEGKAAPLILMRESIWVGISSACRNVIRELSPESTSEYYGFAKFVCQIVCILGQHLVSVWGSSELPVERSQPENFNEVMSFLMDMMQHPSLLIYGYSVAAWSQILHNEKITRDSMMQPVILEWMRRAAVRLVKVGNPSRHDHVTCHYSRLDFDAEDEFNLAFHKLKWESLLTFRAVAVAVPKLSMSFMKESLLHLMSNPNPNAVANWEAMAAIVDASVTEMRQKGILKEPNVADILIAGKEMLQMCLAFNTDDPVILSPFLSFISALFGFVEFAPEQIVPTLNKIFAAVSFGGQNAARTKDVLQVRRHAQALLVKLAVKHPEMLCPSLADLYSTIVRLAGVGELSKSEKGKMFETVVLLSNSMGDFTRQFQFVGEIVRDHLDEEWRTFSRSVDDVLQFISYIGLNRGDLNFVQLADQQAVNRQQMSYCVSLMGSIIRRVAWPHNRELAVKGGYAVPANGEDLSSSANIPRNPAFHHVAPMLPFLFRLFGFMNLLWHPEARSRVHPDLLKIYEMSDAEKNSLLGITGDSVEGGEKPAADKMQSFILNAYEELVILLGSCGPKFGPEFYSSLPALAASESLNSTTGGIGVKVITNVGLAGFEMLPDAWIKIVLRSFLRPLLTHCPRSELTNFCKPIFADLLRFLNWKLAENWDKAVKVTTNGSGDRFAQEAEEDGNDVQEVIEDKLRRMLSRDVLDIVRFLLIEPFSSPWVASKGPGDQSRRQSLGEGEVPDDLDDETQAGKRKGDQRPPESFSDRGALLFEDPLIRENLLALCFRALSWGDSTASSRAAGICKPILHYLAKNPVQYGINPTIAEGLLNSVISGLQVHGEHDANVASLIILAVTLYDALRRDFPVLRSMLLQLPEVTEAELNRYEEKMVAAGAVSNGDGQSHSTCFGNVKQLKPKKEMMKKLYPCVKMPAILSTLKENRVWITRCATAAIICAYCIKVIFPSRRQRSQKLASEIGSPVVTSPERGRSRKYVIDRELFRQFKYILPIILPRLFCSGSGLLTLQSITLIARTFLSIYVASLEGRVVKFIVRKDVVGFFRLLLLWLGVAVPATFVNSSIRFLENELALNFRTRLVNHAYEKYFQDQTFYRVSNLDGRIANADHCLTDDVSEFSQAVARLYSQITKPLLDIFIITVSLIQMGRKRGGSLIVSPVIACACVLITGQILKLLSPRFGKLAAKGAALKASLRNSHTSVITNAEEIAFYSGHKVELGLVKKAYQSFVKHSHDVFRRKLWYVMLEQFLLKYVWSAVGLVMVSIPLLTETVKKNEGSSDGGVGERTEAYTTAQKMLISAGDAAERLMSSYKDVTELAGYSTRVYDMLVTFEDVASGKYFRPGSEKRPPEIRGVVVQSPCRIVLESVPVITPAYDTVVDSLSIVVTRDMHLLITGPNGCGKSSLFRIIAGLWPVYGGKLERPPNDAMFYIPQRPYMMPGTLRSQLIYPDSVETMHKRGITDTDLTKIMDIVHLSHLLVREGGWDAEKDWKDVLSGGEKQRMGMARMFYHKPSFAFLDECTSAVSIDVESKMYQEAKNSGITLLTITHRPSLWKFHTHVLQFDGCGGWRLEQLDASARVSLKEEKLKLEEQLSNIPYVQTRLLQLCQLLCEDSIALMNPAANNELVDVVPVEEEIRNDVSMDDEGRFERTSA